jgi:hypothetical protein
MIRSINQHSSHLQEVVESESLQASTQQLLVQAAETQVVVQVVVL